MKWHQLSFFFLFSSLLEWTVKSRVEITGKSTSSCLDQIMLRGKYVTRMQLRTHVIYLVEGDLYKVITLTVSDPLGCAISCHGAGCHGCRIGATQQACSTL